MHEGVTLFRLIYGQHPYRQKTYPKTNDGLVDFYTGKDIDCPATAMLGGRSLAVDLRLLEVLKGTMALSSSPEELWAGPKIVPALVAPLQCCESTALPALESVPLTSALEATIATVAPALTGANALTGAFSVLANLANPFLNWPKPSS